MTTLSKPDIVKRIKTERRPSKVLVITPLLDPKSQIGDSSVDVRLGTEFIVLKQTNLATIDPYDSQNAQQRIGRYQERVRVGFGEEFILHPNQLVLGSTLEYIAMPQNLTARVDGRSSWGRLGLIIATASSIAPAFKGVVTLELINAGQSPLVLRPGIIIAQLVLSSVSREVAYSGRYDFPTGPQFSRIHEDKDMAIWGERKNFIW